MSGIPLVSVVIPTYNCGHLLVESISSILNQTYKKLELIVVDDSSTDGTDSIVKRLQCIDKRIIYYALDQRLGNVASLLNIGIKLSKGDVLVRQDADDVSMVNRIDKQLHLLLNNKEVQFVSSNYAIFLQNGSCITGSHASQYLSKFGISGILPPLHGTWMYTRKLIDEVSLYDEDFPYAQDYEFFYRVTKKFNKKTIEYPDILYLWRVHGKNVSLDNQKKRQEFISKAIHMYR